MEDQLEIMKLCSGMQPFARSLVLSAARMYHVRWPAPKEPARLALVLAQNTSVKPFTGNGHCVVDNRLCDRIVQAGAPINS
jgi:hypothetical protein